MKLLRLIAIEFIAVLRIAAFSGSGGGFVYFVTSPEIDSELLEFVRALARAVAREDHRKFTLQRETAADRSEAVVLRGKEK
jgi:hypothetical protein